MGKRYKLPFLSKAAALISGFLLPKRVLACVWLAAYEELEDHMVTVYDKESFDGESVAIYEAVSAVRIENIRREIVRKYLKSTLK